MLRFSSSMRLEFLSGAVRKLTLLLVLPQRSITESSNSGAGVACSVSGSGVGAGVAAGASVGTGVKLNRAAASSLLMIRTTLSLI